MTGYERYHFYRDNGICVRCGKPRGQDTNSKAFCKKCAEEEREKDRIKYAECRANHLCFNCRGPIEPEHKGCYCAACRQYQRDRRKALRKERTTEPHWSNVWIPIEVVETGEQFPNMKRAARATGVCAASIGNSIKDGRAIRGLHFRRIENEGN